MATNVQRTQAICDALLNRTSTLAEQALFAEALYDDHPPTGTPFADLTNAQKAAIVPTVLFREARAKVRAFRARKAATDLPDDFPDA